MGTRGLEIVQHCSKRLCCIHHGALKRVKLQGKAALHENIHPHYFIIHSRMTSWFARRVLRNSLTISSTVKSLFAFSNSTLKLHPILESPEHVPLYLEEAFRVLSVIVLLLDNNILSCDDSNLVEKLTKFKCRL